MTNRVFVRSHIIVIFEIFLTTSIDNFLLIWDFFINCTRLVKMSLIFEILELFESWQKIREEGCWSFSAPLPRGRIRIAAHGFLSSRRPWGDVPWDRHRPRSPGCSWMNLQMRPRTVREEQHRVVVPTRQLMYYVACRAGPTILCQSWLYSPSQGLLIWQQEYSPNDPKCDGRGSRFKDFGI